MDLEEALPLLQENHTAVATSVTRDGRTQATVVSTALMDGKLVFASPAHTAKLRNIQRTSPAGLTVINLDTRRYVTVEGPASALARHASAYQAFEGPLHCLTARPPKGPDEEFAQQMRREERGLVFVTPERLYGSLRRRG